MRKPMATYNNQHWLLSHIRNSFISTDDTGLCETVMVSDDLPKQFLQKLNRRKTSEKSLIKIGSMTEENLFCYPGLDLSDDEDLDLASQSYDIPMYPEIGAHRYRSNTAQKLEKMEIARQKAARTKNIKIDDHTVQDNDSSDSMFIKKNIKKLQNLKGNSKLVVQLSSCPKKPQNRFIQYARFDGTSQTGIATKNLNIFLSMLPENQRNYPMKICVAATAKIQEVIGFICYKCNILNPEITLQSVRHYGLYISEDNGEMDMDFPPLDLREPCSKFGFTSLTLAELRPTAHVTRVDYRSLSMTSEIEAVGEAAIADVQGVGNNQSDDMARMLGHNSMIEAPMYRTFRLYIITNGFFKAEVQLGISGERLEIDPVQQKNSKFWSRQKAISYNIESIAFCEIAEKKGNKAVVRIWYLTAQLQGSAINIFPDSPYGPPHLKPNIHSELINSASPQHSNFMPTIHHFKYNDFETDESTAQQIVDKINFILEVRSSVTRREFLIAKEKKKERINSRKLLAK